MPIHAEEPRSGRAAPPHQPRRRLAAPPAGDLTGANFLARSAPARIRLSRARGWRKPVSAVVVARPTRWGNPFRVGETYMWLATDHDDAWPVPTTRAPGTHPDGVRVVRCPDTGTAIEWFRRWATGDYAAEARRLLRGHDLACWCPLDQPCHADVLLELANRRRPLPRAATA